MIAWLQRVIIGWWNVITKNETKEAKIRYEICMQCDKKIKLGRKAWICGECYCELHAKSRSPEEKCLNGKW